MSHATTRRLSFDELVDRETKQLAADLLQQELAKQNLPLPKEQSLQIHLKMIIDAKPDLKELAKANVEARKDSYSDSLRAIGIEPQESMALELDLDDLFGEKE